LLTHTKLRRINAEATPRPNHSIRVKFLISFKTPGALLLRKKTKSS